MFRTIFGFGMRPYGDCIMHSAVFRPAVVWVRSQALASLQPCSRPCSPSWYLEMTWGNSGRLISPPKEHCLQQDSKYVHHTKLNRIILCVYVMGPPRQAMLLCWRPGRRKRRNCKRHGDSMTKRKTSKPMTNAIKSMTKATKFRTKPANP